MVTRREFGKLAVGALALPRAAFGAMDSAGGGVRLGVQTYSFRDLPRPEGGDLVDAIVKAMTAPVDEVKKCFEYAKRALA